jgi:acyl-CoA thioester hydrolase
MKSKVDFRVRYQETDQMGVVHHSVYLIWFEVGRTEWMREKGLAYRECERKGWLLPVVESGVKYLSSSQYDDLIEVETVYTQEKCAVFRFDYIVRRQGDQKMLATGFTRHVCITGDNRINKEATRLLKELLE